MSTLKQTDPASDLILDFIAGGVPGNMGGESGGNYDAVIGNARSTRDLNVLTLTQIYALQAQFLAQGKPSSAIGRYQDIRATLQSLVNARHLPPETIFTEALEDELAIDLLNSACSFKGWRAGTISDATFAHLISCQWASLPDPQAGGKSHYDGVGPNHASTTLKACYAMLEAAREALALSPAPGAIKGPVLPPGALMGQDALPLASATQAPLPITDAPVVSDKPSQNPIELIRQAQRLLGVAGDGDPGPVTRAKATEYRGAHPGA